MLNAAEAALLGRQPNLDGHLLDLAEAADVDQRRRMRIRSGLLWRISTVNDRICLTFNGKVVDLPAHVETDLRFIAEADEFSAADLPGNLDDESRLVLVRRLLEEGFLTLCREAKDQFNSLRARGGEAV